MGRIACYKNETYDTRGWHRAILSGHGYGRGSGSGKGHDIYKGGDAIRIASKFSAILDRTNGRRVMPSWITHDGGGSDWGRGNGCGVATDNRENSWCSRITPVGVTIEKIHG